MVTAIIIISACCHPPVKTVINDAITTAIIAPKYGIKLNNPIINANKIAYFTLKIRSVIDINMATTKLSKNWLDINPKNILFPLEKYLLNLL